MNRPDPASFGDQPGPAKAHFVQPNALAIIQHRGCEYVMFRKQDGTFAAARVPRVA
jgi:hypothetical protein